MPSRVSEKSDFGGSRCVLTLVGTLGLGAQSDGGIVGSGSLRGSGSEGNQSRESEKVELHDEMIKLGIE